MNYYPQLPEIGFIRTKRLIGPDGIFPVSRAHLHELVKRGVFPAPVPLYPGSKIVGFRVEAVREFLERSAANSSSLNNRR